LLPISFFLRGRLRAKKKETDNTQRKNKRRLFAAWTIKDFSARFVSLSLATAAFLTFNLIGFLNLPH
jgi:hypothetical protein